MALLRRIRLYKTEFVWGTGAPTGISAADGSLYFDTVEGTTTPVYARKDGAWAVATLDGDVSLAFADLSGSPTAAQLGSGTASTSTYLRGDLTWNTPAGGEGGASAATATTLGTVKISGTPTDAANPTTYVKEQTDTLLAAKAASSHTHNASAIDAGTLDIARIPTGTAGTTVALGNHTHAGVYANASHTHAQSDVTNLVTDLAGKAATSHTHAAADIATGTVATARLGSGTANSTTYLRGDQTWATVSGGSDPWTILKLTSDFPTTSATAVDVTGLGFTPAAGTYYMWEAVLFLRTGTATVNPRSGWAWPTGMTDGVCTIEQTATATTQILAIGNIGASLLIAVGGVPTNTTSWPALVYGAAIAGASPSGNLRVQIASETAGTTVTVKAGSYLRYRSY